ncbi:MAG: hypothetical protein UY68_C0002G0018 [Parcubacteria group bacterium GW2011_GWF2_52_12]|nr:MAG: hypothetical protein UY66_C0004G0018 [Parcubacteria group bacterium GW2011_GWC1_51_35]KKW25963.1 MAG: hypothetical protein UY68_C0002G0018 [Parcubacteria group bacterium GW2011_GWF2_52_12]KKW27362.1 MAG: hypothetical protein UY69_C0014G0012 [Parcubacteria group bacterium GW2011_GWF1_52_5]
MDRIVVVASGLPYSGKSWQIQRMLGLPGFQKAVVVRMDDVRVQLYGDRSDTHVTKSEHLFKNEKTRNLILEQLVLGAELVLTEAILLTEEGHQKPFLEMLERADNYVQVIEQEYAKRDNARTPDSPSMVFGRVILFHASLAATERRIERSSADRRESNAAVFDLQGLYGAVSGLEYPKLYQPLVVDTSDESGPVHARQVEEIQDFVFRGLLPSDQKQRWNQMLQHHEQLRKALKIS